MYLELKYNTYLAKLDLSPKVAKALGKRRFVKSLQTSDLAEAKRKAAVLEALWRAEIAAVTSGAVVEKRAEFWRGLLKMATPEERALLMVQLDDEVDGMLDASGVDKAEEGSERLPEALQARRFVKIATGRLTSLESFLEPFRAAQTHIEAKTLHMQLTEATKFSQKFKYMEDVNAQEWVDMMIADGKAPGTIKKSITFIRGFLRFIKKGSEDLFKNVEMPKIPKKMVSKTNVRPFTPAEVSQLYATALKEGKTQLADLIDIGRWTGARLEEICRLKVSDIQEGHFNITDAKSQAGNRAVPIHPELQPVLDRLCKESADGYVLSGLTFSKFGDRSNMIGKRFGLLKSKMGYDRSKVFHSIRKTVVTQLENAGVLENIAADIVGHDKPNITFGLYGGGASLEVKAEALRKLRYP
jgi:integrase